MKNPKLDEAVAIFKKLGWKQVTEDNILQLPLGTAEEKRIAVAGLKSGDWGEAIAGQRNWRSYIDVDREKLALFAICVGVNAKRAEELAIQARLARHVDSSLLISAVASRGAKFANDFVIMSYRGGWASFSNESISLVDKLNLDIPQSIAYIEDWAIYVADTIEVKLNNIWTTPRNPEPERIAMIQRRFKDHIIAGIAQNVPPSPYFAPVIPAGVERGWLERDYAAELAFSGLDASVRPSDRKMWLDVLDELKVSDEEFCSRIDMLIPIVATGDLSVINRLAPMLIANTQGAQLAELLVASFSIKTKKGKLLVLKAALKHKRIEDVEAVSGWLEILANDADKAVAAAATKLMEQWGIAYEAAPTEAPVKAVEIRGLWQPTPPVWQVPAFELGEVSPESLAALVTEFVNRRGAIIHDCLTERFLAVANALAYKDPAAARSSLSGLKMSVDIYYSYLPDFIAAWAKGEESKISPYNQPHPLHGRDYAVSQQLDKLPCLLSTPSKLDLSITMLDLLARLTIYKDAKIKPLDKDLQLALMRLDPNTRTAALDEDLQALGVFTRYIDNLPKEPSLLSAKSIWWDVLYSQQFSVFPHWGDAALRSVCWVSNAYDEKGLILRQVARRASPLPAGAAINILAVQRSSTPIAAEDAMLAVREAWGRGLLRPGVADIALLDWTGELTNLASLATALDGIIQAGLLSVVWPILDALVAKSTAAPRLCVGTAELAKLMLTYLPEVRHAVDKGLADAKAFDLQGIRALAQRGGSSLAVTTAKEIVTMVDKC
ncbi:MAG: hypothetical protein LBV04_08230 [Deferribacteraceae bacterium]|jgi:hypothetical protein|nr:hypothetical protein [Deferribacteraceae bacterium]